MASDHGTLEPVARPSWAAALSSPTMILNAGASSVVLLSGFLPIGVDAAGEGRRPFIQAAKAWQRLDVGHVMATTATMWPHGFALITLVTFIGLALVRPRRIDRFLALAPIGGLMCIASAWSMLLFSVPAGSRQAMLAAAIALPATSFVAARAHWLARTEQPIAAATWLQGYLCVLMVFSIRWVSFPPYSGIAWGGYIVILGAVAMLISSWGWRSRAVYDLSDRSVRPEPLQSSILTILIGTLITAIALAYWNLFRT